MNSPRILLFAEAVTLAHVARIFKLATNLEDFGHEVHVATDSRFNYLFGRLPKNLHPLFSISGESFMGAMNTGRPPYNVLTLERYVAEEKTLIEKIKPDVVIGDFRLSLQVSTFKKVPYIALINAYWSPYADIRFPIPDHFIGRIFGRNIGQFLFNLARPFIFYLHTRPVNALRKKHGLPEIKGSLQNIYTQADYVAYADSPSLVLLKNLPHNHVFIGPVLSSLTIPKPEWWDTMLQTKSPKIYLNLGSSGNQKILGSIVETLASFDATLIVSAGSETSGFKNGDRLFVAPYLPGDEACQVADVVICNGGSPSAQQALSYGKPVIGIPSNLDQSLNTEALAQHKTGMTVYPGWNFATRLKNAVEQALSSEQKSHALWWKEELSKYDSGKALQELIQIF